LLVTLSLAAVALVWLFNKLGVDGMLNIGLMALGLSFVIFFHELGHFTVAKWCDVHVETFSIGFGPAIPGCSFRRGETFYKIAWFPLGGYVKMVGEGAESDESDDDPRAFKNKSVGQRMLIISAGVIMNVILGLACFVFVYMTHGVEQQPAVICTEEPGGPAWQKDLPIGAEILQIGDSKVRYWEDLLFKVMLSSKREKLKLAYRLPDDPDVIKQIEIEPRREKEDIKPVIGIGSPTSLTLPYAKGKGVFVAQLSSPAAKAEPPFQPGDTIVGTTDPDQNSPPYDPSRVKLLPPDPRRPDKPQPDYFEFRRRLRLLAGKPMILQVRRQGAGPADPLASVAVGPAYHWTFGMRMRMGQIMAVRDDSPAARAGIRPRDPNQEGDILDQVEVTEPDGSKTAYVTSRNKPLPTGVRVLDLDPLKLPDQLQEWAGRKKGERTLTLTVLRKVGHVELEPVKLTADWDDRWKNDEEVPQYATSPLSIAGLGLAYRVETVVEAVEAGSPAEQAGLKRGDLIKAIRFRFHESVQKPDRSEPGKWVELKPDQWAHEFWTFEHLIDFKEVSLRVESGKQLREVDLAAKEDMTWPALERGVLLPPEAHLQKADGLWQAAYLGMERTYQSIVNIYLNLRAIITNRVSYETIGGPLMIAAIAYNQASMGTYFFLMFLGMISINLAVINFLPIPILDGGHMVFLIYEKIRGVPASETVRVIAAYLGVAFLLALMVFAFWQDIIHLFW
jgi:regulator of sigma E protease